LRGGEKVTQSVTIDFSGSLATVRGATTGDQPVAVVLGGEAATRMPAIGLRVPLQAMDAANGAVELIRQAGPKFLSGRIDPRAGHGPREMRALGELAARAQADLTLELVVPCRADPAEELAALARQLKESGTRPRSILVAAAEDRIRQDPGPPPPPSALLAAVYRAARASFPDIEIGGGTFCFFAELNRNWPPIGLIDYVAHMSCSVVHASDDRSMMENLEAYQRIVQTVKACAGDKPHHVLATGIGLHTPPAGEPAANADNCRHTLGGPDPRHRGLFGAAWVLATIGELARGGVAAVAPAGVVGGAGIVHSRQPSPQPWFDDLDAPAVLPVFHVVAGMSRAAGRVLVESAASERSRVATVAFRTAEGGTELWLANLRDRTQPVALPGMGGEMQLAQLEPSSFAAAARYPGFLRSTATPLQEPVVDLGPYAVARIQIGG
jgi:hypothetical protein